MSGKQHITSGIPLLIITHELTVSATFSKLPVFVTNRIKAFSAEMVPDTVTGCILCGILFLMGLIFPDIDDENSIMGRYVHLPVKHRKWFHSIYLFIPLLTIGRMKNCFLWLCLGCFYHLLMDSFSRCGVAWFRPKTGYIEYPSGVKIKKNHYICLYTGNISAWILCGLLWISGIYCILFRYQQFF